MSEIGLLAYHMGLEPHLDGCWHNKPSMNNTIGYAQAASTIMGLRLTGLTSQAFVSWNSCGQTKCTRRTFNPNFQPVAHKYRQALKSPRYVEPHA